MKTINILGDIINSEQDRWYYAEVSPAEVIDALQQANGEPVEININSNGGSVTGGLAIANAIKRYPGETTCNVLGIAASMASVIACSAKRCTMGQGSFLMIHNPWAYTSGTAEDLRKDADTLDKQRDSLISFYKAYCNKSEDEIKAMMDAETWIPAEQAKDFGFNFETYGGELKAAASLTRRAIDKAPEAAKALLKFSDKKPETKPETKAESTAENAAEPVAEQVAEPTTEAAVENAPEAPQKPAESTAEAKVEQTPAKPAENWEARFKGLSTKYNELQKEYKAKVDALTAENENLKSQQEQSGKDLAAAQAKVSELTTKLDEGAKALLKANNDLAEVRNSLTAEQDKVKHLESTRDMLTAGVLTPPSVGTTYADKMKAAKTPEERENLRKQKASGKIK